MNQTLRRAAALAIVLMLAPCLPARAASDTQAQRYYPIDNGSYYELVDRAGNTAPLADRPLDSAWTLVAQDHGGAEEILAYALIDGTTPPVEEEAAGGEAPNFGRSTALLFPDGRVMRDYRDGAYYSAEGRYIVQTVWRPRGDAPDVLEQTQTLIDPDDGGDLDPLPGRRIESITACGEGLLVLAQVENPESVAPGDAPKASAPADQLFDAVYLDGALAPVFTVPCRYARPGRWRGETVLLVTDGYDDTGKIISGRSTVYDLKGSVLAGPYVGETSFAEETDGTMVLSVYQDGRHFIVDEDTLALVAQADGDAEIAYRGGLGVALRTESKGDVGTQFYRVVDTSGREILPEIKGSFFFSETSPIVAEEHRGGVRWCAVFARDGTVTVDWHESEGGSVSYLSGGDAVCVAEANTAILYLPDGIKTAVAPAGAQMSHVDDDDGVFIARYSMGLGSAYNFFSAFLDVDTGTLGKPYNEIYVLDHSEDPVTTFVTGMYMRRSYYQGLVDRNGDEILPCRYESLRKAGDLFAVSIGSWYGLIDGQGRWVVRRSALKFLAE